MTNLFVEVAPKRLELLHELLPTAKVMALLVNPADRNLAQIQSREVLSAARNRGLELHVLNVRSEGDFDAVFADIKRLRVGGLVIGAGPVFLRGLDKLAALTVRHAVPAIYSYRVFPAAGGLMSYGTDIFDSYRLAGIYTGAVVGAVVGPVRLRESLSVPPPAPLFSASSPPCVKTRHYNDAISL